jgi:hypothetical protein
MGLVGAPADVRYTGSSLGYQVVAVIAGADRCR